MNSIETALAAVFGPEWWALSDDDKALIVRDCTEGGEGLRSIADAGEFTEYRANIGTGNLAAYARVMRVRFGGAK